MTYIQPQLYIKGNRIEQELWSGRDTLRNDGHVGFCLVGIPVTFGWSSNTVAIQFISYLKHLLCCQMYLKGLLGFIFSSFHVQESGFRGFSVKRELAI